MSHAHTLRGDVRELAPRHINIGADVYGEAVASTHAKHAERRHGEVISSQ